MFEVATDSVTQPYQETIPDSQPVISVRDLTVRYGDTLALQTMSFDIAEGDKVAIIGPNGAGKSTLMKALMGLLQPARDSKIVINGGVHRLGYVPQHDDVNWDFPVTVHDVVLMGLIRQIGWLRLPQRKHHKRVAEALERVGLLALSKRQVNELSGGQKRRVFMARALAQQSDILILDEPFAGVDVGAQDGLMTIIDRLNEQGITIILSTHDLVLASDRFTKVMALNRRLIAFGLNSEVYQPDVLKQLYGGAVWHLPVQGDAPSQILVVDEHGCDDCG